MVYSCFLQLVLLQQLKVSLNSKVVARRLKKEPKLSVKQSGAADSADNSYIGTNDTGVRCRSIHCFCKNIDYRRFKMEALSRSCSEPEEHEVWPFMTSQLRRWADLWCSAPSRGHRVGVSASAGTWQATRRRRLTGRLVQKPQVVANAARSESLLLPRLHIMRTNSLELCHILVASLIRTIVLVCQYVRLIYGEGSSIRTAPESVISLFKL